MIFIIVFLFLSGLFIGSFLGVAADRLPINKTIVRGRSQCDFCKKELAWYDLIPLLSFVSLMGKCRYCNKKLPIFYPLVELLTGVVFAFCGVFFFNLGIYPIIFYLAITGIFLSIFFADLKHGIIPDRLTIAGILITFIYLFLLKQNMLLIHLLAGIGAFIFFVVISYTFLLITKKESMGGGDIKLSFLLGFFLGFPNIIVALYIAFLTAAASSTILILWKKKRFRKDSLRFGPFLISATLISMFYGDTILKTVLRILGI